MGDLSDLPNFRKRPWYRRKNYFRTVVVAVGAIAGMVAWCLSADDPAEDILIVANSQPPQVQSGSPYTLETVIKNSGERTAQIHIQLALYMKESACMEAGKRLSNSFSLPMTLSISPNGSKTVMMQFDAITAPCAGTAGVEVFADGKMDLDRITINRKLDAPAIKLL